MKKGFTLVELMAIFTLLGIILVITIPQITSLIKKSGGESYQSFEESIKMATEAYITDKKIEVVKNGPAKIIYIKDIIASGYLKSNLKNPKTNQKLKDMDLTKVRVSVNKNNDGVLSIDFIDGW